MQTLCLILGVACAAVIAIFANHFCSAFFGHDYVGDGYTGQIIVFQEKITNFLSLDPTYYILSVVLFLALTLFFVDRVTNQRRKEKEKLKGKEYGEAQWATAKEMSEFRADNFEDNFILSEHTFISIPAIKRTQFQQAINKVARALHIRFQLGVADRNKHILIVGGSGSGKTFNIVGPNLLQAKCSYVSTDPKGDTVKKYGNWLLNNGYKVKVINIKDTESFPYSFKYNPFKYIKNQASIMNLVSIIIENTEGLEDERAKEDFWIKAERCLYMCLIGYLYYYYADYPEYQTIPHMLDLIELADASEQNEEAVSALDIIMDEYKDELIARYGSEEQAKLGEEWFVLKQYKGFKKAPGETAKSIIVSCFVRLSPFAVGTVRDMFSDDELELEKLGEEKTALFMIMSDTNKTFNFILAMIFYQLFDINVRIADASPGSHCKIPIMCILDEMKNIGRIPDLDVKIATLRSRWINLVPILQTMSQLDAGYGKEKAKIIKANCDTFVYLGKGDTETCEEISKRLGKTTVTYDSTSKSKTGISVSKQKTGVDLMSAADLESNPHAFNDSECLIMIKQAHPYKDTKYSLLQHPRFSEYQKSGVMNVEEYTTTVRAKAWRERQEEIRKIEEEEKRSLYEFMIIYEEMMKGDIYVFEM